MSDLQAPIEKLVIIGSGPASWTAAIYAARANLAPVIYEGAISEENRLRGTLPLGQLNLTTEVENFPGFPKGILGPRPDVRHARTGRAMRRSNHHRRHRVDRIETEPIHVARFDRCEDPNAQRHHLHRGRARITSAWTPRRNTKTPVSALCAVCDGALPRFRNQPLIVVGGGDSACEEGTYLTKFASTVYLVHRREKLRASPVMADRILSNRKVKPIWNSAVDEVYGDDEKGMTGVVLKNLVTGEKQKIASPGMFVAIGHTPNTKFLNGQLQLDDKGFVVLDDPARTTTNVPGVFAAGGRRRSDLQAGDHRSRQRLQGVPRRRALACRQWNPLMR